MKTIKDNSYRRLKQKRKVLNNKTHNNKSHNNKTLKTSIFGERKLNNATHKATHGAIHGAINKKIFLPIEKIELLLFLSTLINYYILCKKGMLSRKIYKQNIIILFEQLSKRGHIISKNATKKQIELLYISQEKIIKQILDNLEKNHNGITQRLTKRATQNVLHLKKHHGGFYFKSLEDKGEQPITGADLTKLLDDVQQFFYNAKYTSEGQFLQDTDTLLSMLRGDVDQFKSILQYRIFPKYYTSTPPFINWEGVKEAIQQKKWEDIPDYLLAYQSYLRSRDEYLVEKGEKPPSVLQKDLYNGFYNNMAHALDNNMQQFQQYRNKYQGKFFPIKVPQ